VEISQSPKQNLGDKRRKGRYNDRTEGGQCVLLGACLRRTTRMKDIEAFSLALLNSATCAHIQHWQAKSYSTHKALGKYYKAIPDLVDRLVESYMSRPFLSISPGPTASTSPMFGSSSMITWRTSLLTRSTGRTTILSRRGFSIFLASSFWCRSRFGYRNFRFRQRLDQLMFAAPHSSLFGY